MKQSAAISDVLKPFVPPGPVIPVLWLPAVISSLSPATAGPGDTIVINGQGFGSQQGAGYVLFSDNGVNWGQPGDLAAFQLVSWSDTQITFFVPVKDSNGYQTMPGTTATVTVTNGGGRTSNPENLALQPAVSTTPVISSLNPATAGPGDKIVLNGQGFGSQQGTGYVLFSDNGVNWGQPGDIAPFQLASWSDTQIAFLVPVKGNGYQITPGTAATVTVTNAGSLTSNQQSLALHSAVKWPVSSDSGITTIGTTGNGFVDTTVTIDQAGNLTASTRVWDTSGWGPFTGFHTGVVVQLYDTFGDVIGTFYPPAPFGVEGGQTNVNAWSATLTAAQCAELYSVSVVNFYDPQDTGLTGMTSWVVSNAAAIAAAAAAVVAAV
jgi:IPT/TIG domain